MLKKDRGCIWEPEKSLCNFSPYFFCKSRPLCAMYAEKKAIFAQHARKVVDLRKERGEFVADEEPRLSHCQARRRRQTSSLVQTVLSQSFGLQQCPPLSLISYFSHSIHLSCFISAAKDLVLFWQQAEMGGGFLKKLLPHLLLNHCSEASRSTTSSLLRVHAVTKKSSSVNLKTPEGHELHENALLSKKCKHQNNLVSPSNLAAIIECLSLKRWR